MVENRPWANFFAHTVLIIGVALVVFPVYIAVVASTQAPGELMRGTLPFSDVLFLADLRHPDATGRGAYYSHLPGGCGS